MNNLNIGTGKHQDDDRLITKEKMRIERIRVLYNQASFVIVGNLIVATILGTFVFEWTKNIITWYWVLFVAVLTIFRYLMIPLFLKSKRDDKEVIRWGSAFVFGAFISGSTWGATAILFFKIGDATLMIFLLMTLTGIVAASSAVLSNYVMAYYAFAVPATLPFVYVLMSAAQPGHIELASMLLVFLVLQLTVSSKNQNSLDNSILLRTENAGLIEELRVKNNKLESASIAKTRFLAAASHDLRQPLHALGLFVDVLEDRIKNIQQNKIIGKIRKSMNSLGAILDSLLGISKLDAGVVRANIAPFSVQRVFDFLRDEFSPLSEEKGLDLRILRTQLWIDSDERMVERILRNLISNAIRYTDHGKIVVGCRRSSDTVTIVVGDTGIGIDADNTEIIFEEFRQLNNESRDRSKGLGLGLSIVKRMALLLGTDVRVQSILGHGSVFSIKLPRGTPSETHQLQNDILNLYASLEGKLLVLIEDEAEIRSAISMLLKEWGGRVLDASTIDDLKLKLGKSEKPDLILADYRLAGNLNGIDAIHQIRSHIGDNTIPAIVITGDTAPERIREAQMGGFLIMHKPISGGKLRAALNTHILVK